MALNFNRVFLAGNMTHDPELRLTQSGKKTVTFNIAVNSYSKGNGNATDFFTLVAWEEKAEFICTNFHKGKPIFVEGGLKNESWTDKQGNKRTATKVVVSNVLFSDNKSDSGTSPAVGNGNYIPDAYKPSGKSENTSSFETITSDDQLPF